MSLMSSVNEAPQRHILRTCGISWRDARGRRLLLRWLDIRFSSLFRWLEPSPGPLLSTWGRHYCFLGWPLYGTRLLDQSIHVQAPLQRCSYHGVNRVLLGVSLLSKYAM